MDRMNFASVETAAEALRQGGVAIVPTDTVVGLVASAVGLSRLAGTKDRDPAKPIALLCRSPEEAFAMASEVPKLAHELARRYWPGPLTLVLDDSDGGTVGVRVPDDSVVRDLLSALGEPLHATSANLAGEPAPRALKDVHPRLLNAVDVIVDGAAGSGEASAVVDLSGGNVRLLRSRGDLTEDTLNQLRNQA
jgi:L-threonylcarbamoyladenylate synthase